MIISKSYKILLKFILITSLLLINIASYAQLKNFGSPEMLVGMSIEDVTTYFNALNSKSNNKAYKIQKEYTEEGNLQLKVEFSMIEEVYYNCLNIKATFEKVKAGLMCTEQTVYFTNKVADINIEDLNKKFKKFEGNEWRMTFTKDIDIRATLHKIDDSYMILYLLRMKE